MDLETKEMFHLILSELKEMKGDMHQLKLDVSELKEDVTVLKSNQTVLLEAINTLQQNEQEHFTTLSNKDAELETVVRQNCYDIALLRSRIS
ncbi:MAG: hypothetical protein ACLUKQ_00040 [Peptococcaceae bacterium]